MRILGIDPGLTGGCAIYDAAADVCVDAIDIPTIGEGAKKRVDAAELGRWVRRYSPEHGVIERAQAMPQQGSSSGFIYGRGVGYLEACVVLCDVPLKIIEVMAWKKHFGLKGKSEGGGEAARALVIQRFPRVSELFARKMDHGRAEALLIAIYGATIVSNDRSGERGKHTGARTGKAAHSGKRSSAVGRKAVSAGSDRGAGKSRVARREPAGNAGRDRAPKGTVSTGDAGGVHREVASELVSGPPDGTRKTGAVSSLRCEKTIDMFRDGADEEV